MKRKITLIMFLVGVAFLFAGFFAGEIGNLIGIVLTAIGMFIIGITLSCIVITDVMKKMEERRSKTTWLTLGIAIVCLIMGSKDLIAVAQDINQGTKEARISDCQVMKSASKRKIYRHYDLVGNDENGKNIVLPINKEVYEKYAGLMEFDVYISYWEHCGVIEKIIE